MTKVVIMANYNENNEELNVVDEPSFSYLISYSQNGMPYQLFDNQTNTIPFNQGEWSDLLHISERTFQRYKKENKTFESIYTEKILEIILLFRRGREVFGSTSLFYEWLNTPNSALEGKKPFSIIDNTFGIQLVTDILGRIERGVYS
jgi:putative toxin-antitoxin system antitoxin component (TIGR02293 family)